ncbi:MAG: hypothetical protein J3K34DRAFT_156578 [Monoraphidium minutum]|nr:MAG: hypothetical protein J3K34DRAFT_156578 [Monoraphidium minutum]
MRVTIAILASLALLGFAASAPLSVPLPEARPPLWPFRGFNDARSWSCAMTKNGALVLEVEHAEIPGVTGEQLRWLYAGGAALASVHPGDNKVYSNFMLWHPREHVAHNVTHLPLKAKDTQHAWVETTLTGCRANGDVSALASAPFVCPKAGGGPNPGFVAGASPALLAAAETTDAVTTLLDIGKDGLEVGVEGCNEKGNCAYVVKTWQTWQDTAGGLRLSTRQQLGLDLGLAEGKINPLVISTWAQGSDPYERRAAARAALGLHTRAWGDRRRGARAGSCGAGFEAPRHATATACFLWVTPALPLARVPAAPQVPAHGAALHRGDGSAPVLAAAGL